MPRPFRRITPSPTERIPLATDPMSSSNPSASAGSPRGYDAPKKKRNKWLWIGLPILLLIIIGAVLGGVLGTQLNKDDKSTSSGSGNSNNGQPANTGVPSGVSDVSTNTQTGANGGRILAIQTDSYLLPVYATGVSLPPARQVK